VPDPDEFTMRELQTTQPDVEHPRFARAYMRMSSNGERRGATEHRRRLLAGLSGTIVELGAGHGLNFPHYPADVTEVTAVEPSRRSAPRPHARRRTPRFR
jgi:hypothetical protein